MAGVAYYSTLFTGSFMTGKFVGEIEKNSLPKLALF